MTNDESERKLLDVATELASSSLDEDGGEGTMALKAVLLIQYISSDGKTYDGYVHAGDPRFSELFGMLESHRLRVRDWFENQLIAQQEARDDDDD